MFVPQYKKLVRLYDFVKEYNAKHPSDKIGLDCKQHDVIKKLQQIEKNK